MTKVTIMYKYQGEINQNENQEGILFPNGKCFSCADGEFDLYKAVPTENPGVVVVDLDDENNGYVNLYSEPKALMDLLLAN